jgi:protein PhnA
VLSYRLLKRLGNQELLDMIYLDEDELSWANEGLEDESKEPTLDSNGTPLKAGDSVTIIKDLDVKGAGFTAKRGTVVKNISLTDNPEQIEGRVNGVKIVLLSKFLKKV